MSRPQELVDRRHLLQSEACVDQDAGIACEGHRVAGDANHDLGPGLGDLGRLIGGPGAGRVEDDGVAALQVERRQRAAEQVAGLGRDWSKARGGGDSSLQRGYPGGRGVGGEDRGDRAARGKVKVPAPQKRSAIFFAPRTASTARSIMAASASGTA